MKNKFIALGLLVLITLSCNEQKPAQPSQELPYQKEVDSILALMTLEEKIGQLNLPSSGDITTGQAKSSDIASKIAAGKVGGLFNIKTAAKIKEVQRIAVEESRLKIPLLFGMDVIHGYQSTFPIPLGLAASWDMDLIQQTARVAAQEASADGINWTFSPMVDISRDPRWGRISEGSGEDPFLGGKIAAAMVRGYQGDDLSANNTLLACVKHFALYGASEAGRDYNTVDMSRVRMYNDYLPPYKAAIDAGVASVMASFNEVDGIPATANKWLLTDVLREQWGFNGFVVSDYTGINEMVAHGIGNLQQVSARALNAGLDMDMVGEGFLTTLKKSLEEGLVSETTIDTAVKRILTAKYQLGLFDDPYKYCDTTRTKNEVFTKENRDFARKVSAESMVLLKNEGLLPLKKSGSIALIGPLANTPHNMAGTWSVATQQEKSISVLEGLKEVAGEAVTINYAKGSNVAYDEAYEKRITMFGKEITRDGRTDAQLLAEALAVAKKSDVVVAAIGETAERSGESSSITNLQIPKAQQDLLDALLATGKPVVVVLFTGRPLAITKIQEEAPAIINAWFPGSEAGLAIADVLFGAVNPSGKLTATFPRNVGQVPLFYAHKNTGRPLDPAKTADCGFQKFTSNYLDVCNTPLYPFGFGLSYTTFSYSDITLDKAELGPNDSITVSVKVKNTGNFDGKEVVQLYVRDVVRSTTPPVRELKGFKKIFLKKDEEQIVQFKLQTEDLKFYDTDLNFIAEPGEFQVFVGGDSTTELQNRFELVN
ncbi:beta-glucosidase BglX [Croceivirga radicis]|uniref:beta-glucosidase BglX n=1 Tax=Croceivirga radicis TaxID=1929488 RepID=UPI000255B37D|nr:beta-glucosidase BglX [Croceivirga radicis]